MARPPGSSETTGSVDFGPSLQVADSVLYEGYLLYPYRRSSAKNQVRWQFGVLAPRHWVTAGGTVTEEAATDNPAGSAEWWWNQTECLLEAPAEARVEIVLRFLELELAAAASPEVNGAPIDRGVPREVRVALELTDLLEKEQVVEITTSPKEGGEAASPAAFARREQVVSARLVLRAERRRAPFPVHRLSVRTENTTIGVDAGARRPDALRRSLVATHLLLGLDRGTFLSLLEPPEWARPAAAECTNVRLFPVLADPGNSGQIALAAPIILYDHPQVAPESPGDLFDATEIDEILSLRTLTLTEEEKAEARATDPRAAAIVDRVEAMPTEVLARLHGAVRSLRPVAASGREANDAEGQTTPAMGTPILGVGSRVRLRPRRRGTDAQDMFLAGRPATVSEMLDDVDGSCFVAVTLDDDPRASIPGGPGRVRHFSLDEVEPLPAVGVGEQ